MRQCYEFNEVDPGPDYDGNRFISGGGVDEWFRGLDLKSGCP